MKKFLFILIPLIAFAQNSSLCKEEEKKYQEILNGNYTPYTVKIKLNNIVDTLQDLDDDYCISNLLTNINFQLFDLNLKSGNLDECLENDELLKKFASDGKLNQAQLIHLAINESELSYYVGDFSNSMRKANSVISKYDNNLQVQDLARLYDIIGKNYLQLYKQDNKREHYLDSANFFFNKSYSILKEDNSFKFSKEKGRFYNNKLDYIMAKNDFREALKTANRALIINDDKSNYNPVIQKYYLTIATAYYHLGKYDSALYYNRLIEPFISKESLDERLKLYDLYQKTYESLGEEDSANKYLTQNIHLLQNLNKAKSNSMKTLYGIDIENLEKVNTQNSFDSRGKTFSILALLIILGGVFGAFYYRNKKEKERYETLFQEKYKELQYLQHIPTQAEASQELDAEEPEPQYESEVAVKKKSVKNSQPKNPLTQELIEELEEKIKNMEEKELYRKSDFSLNYLSKKLKTNTAYLSYYFNHIKKQSFPNYLNHLRINFILNELNTNPKLMQYSMEGLAKESGFKDASVFSKIFKRIVGMPPSYYVDNLKKERKKEQSKMGQKKS